MGVSRSAPRRDEWLSIDVAAASGSSRPIIGVPGGPHEQTVFGRPHPFQEGEIVSCGRFSPTFFAMRTRPGLWL